MKKNCRFVYQDNQFWGECLPCTLAVFNTIVSSAVVGWKITTRQAVEYAVAHGLSLDKWTMNSDFQRFCLKREAMPQGGETFRRRKAVTVGKLAEDVAAMLYLRCLRV